MEEPQRTTSYFLFCHSVDCNNTERPEITPNFIALRHNFPPESTRIPGISLYSRVFLQGLIRPSSDNCCSFRDLKIYKPPLRRLQIHSLFSFSRGTALKLSKIFISLKKLRVFVLKFLHIYFSWSFEFCVVFLFWSLCAIWRSTHRHSIIISPFLFWYANVENPSLVLHCACRWNWNRRRGNRSRLLTRRDLILDRLFSSHLLLQKRTSTSFNPYIFPLNRSGNFARYGIFLLVCNLGFTIVLAVALVGVFKSYSVKGNRDIDCSSVFLGLEMVEFLLGFWVCFGKFLITLLFAKRLMMITDKVI